MKIKLYSFFRLGVLGLMTQIKVNTSFFKIKIAL